MRLRKFDVYMLEQVTIVGNVNLASNRDYIHGANIRILFIWNKQGAVAPKRT